MLLGSPLTNESIRPALRSAFGTVSKLCNRIKTLDSHTGLFFLANHTSAPRLSHLMRTTPTFHEPQILEQIDEEVRATAEQVANVRMSGLHWEQASLPVRFGGLGIRNLRSLSYPCFIASLTSAIPLMNEIANLGLQSNNNSQPASLLQAIASFTAESGMAETPVGEAAGSQRVWDEISSRSVLDRLLSYADQINRARLLAASTLHSGAWLQAVPLPNLGLALDDETTRISVALRLGAPVCQPHRCRCGRMIDLLGHHGLSCRYSAYLFFIL